MITVEHFPQRDKRYFNKNTCKHRVRQFLNQPDEGLKPCKHKACYIIDGVELCQLHAGYACLVYCLKENEKGEC